MATDLTAIRAHLTRRIEEFRAVQAKWPVGTHTHFAAVTARYELEDVLRWMSIRGIGEGK